MGAGELPQGGSRPARQVLLLAHLRLSLVACLALAGCTSTITAQTARTLPADDKLIFFAGGAHYSSFCIECDHYNWIPHAELGLRSGIRDGIDFGLKVGTYGFVQSDVKFALVRSARFDLAVAPALSVNTAFFQTWGLDLRPMVLAGLNLRKEPFEAGSLGITLGAAPIARAFITPSQSNAQPTFFAQAIGSATFWWYVTERVALMFETSRLQTLALNGVTALSEDFSVTQFALSVQYRFILEPDRDMTTMR